MCIRNNNNNNSRAIHHLGAPEINNNPLIKHPIRKSRTKTRRPKFLSLRLELISQEIPMTPKPSPPQKQLTLFPLHPENLVEDRDENVALMFNSDVVSSWCSLQSFLPNYGQSSEEECVNLVVEEEEEEEEEEEDGGWLVRTAMRSREREAAEDEKWVCYSEVVEKNPEASWTAEVTSTAADEWVNKKRKMMKKVEIGKQLWLKLDYEGILNAWSDKAPLFINGESPPQTVPDLHDHPTLSSHSLIPNRCVMDGMGSEGNVWKVPEMGLKKEEEGLKMGQREASVLRYKEKRQSRLFSKRIRYEVRKLNAEKRPRMKGRFVKRS